MADNLSDLVRILGDRAQLLYVSPSCERILGFTRAEMLEMEPRALLPPEEQEAARLLTDSLRADSADCSNEEKARRARARYRLETFDTVCAYGDTAEDHALLSLADHASLGWQ